jgi:hypothetical protein
MAGNTEAATSDTAAALAIQPSLAEQFAKWGIPATKKP